MPATMSLIGLYNYDPTIFDNLTLPSGLDKQTLIDNLCLRSGDFELLYPSASFMKQAVGAWSAKWYATFERWVNALAIEYDPLENYNRYEHWTDDGTGAAIGATSGQSDSTTTEKVSPYDAGATDFSNKGQTTIGSTDSTGTTSNTENHSIHDGRIHGNIGVTTSQQMLISELDLGYWNIYERIIGLFLTEFVLPIY